MLLHSRNYYPTYYQENHSYCLQIGELFNSKISFWGSVLKDHSWYQCFLTESPKKTKLEAEDNVLMLCWWVKFQGRKCERKRKWGREKVKTNVTDVLPRWPQLHCKQSWLLDHPGQLQEVLMKLLLLRTALHTGQRVSNAGFFLSPVSHGLSFIYSQT